MKIEIGKIYVHHRKWWNQPYCVENHFDQKVKVLKKTKCNGKIGYLVQGVQDEWHKNTNNMEFEQRFVTYAEDLYEVGTTFPCQLF